ncbi:MAG: DHHW family protein [Clostridium sp.]
MRYKYITSVIALIILFSLGNISMIIKDKKYSDEEGRKLKERPIKEEIVEYEKKIGTGEVQGEWDTYFSDQMIGRTEMVNVYIRMQKALGKKKINGVYLGADNYLISESTVEKTTEENLLNKAKYYEEVNRKIKKEKMYLVNVPHKIMVHEKNIPIEGYREKGNLYMDSLFSGIEKLGIIDLRDVFKGEDLNYYKTDHHLNMNGVYEGYKQIINSINKEFTEVGEPLKKEQFEIKKYENYFLGSDGRKVSILEENLEDIEIYNNEIIKGFKTNIKSIYRKDKLNKAKLNNDYTVYLGGDNPKVEIKNNKANNKLKVAIIGDSIDNPLVPLLGIHFKETYNYDLRHYKGDIIEEINKKDVDIVLLIALSNNFILGNNGPVFNFKGKSNEE